MTARSPWVDAGVFAQRALEMSAADFEAAQGLTFFDRGVVDAAVAMAAAGGDDPTRAMERSRHDRLFLAPPWPEIYVNDEDRRHSLEKALSDYKRVQKAYIEAGYSPIILPRTTSKLVPTSSARAADLETSPAAMRPITGRSRGCLATPQAAIRAVRQLGFLRAEFDKPLAR